MRFQILGIVYLVFQASLGEILSKEPGLIWIPSSNEMKSVQSNHRSLADSNSTIYEYLLQWHNNYRNLTARGKTSNQPSAKNMNQLFWDASLAAVAQAYSEKCIWEHNSDRDSDLEEYSGMTSFQFDTYSLSVGENLYATTASLSIDSLIYGITAWYDEYSLFTYSDPFSYNSAAGHYTQLVWAETRYVGCGYTVCDSLTNTGFSNAVYLVCDYFPAGNVASSTLYKSGTECTSCPSDRTSCSSGLCSGCQSEWWTYCDDYYSNCASLSSACPSSCNVNSTNSYCKGCRTTCDTCTTSMLTAPSTCTDGTSTTVIKSGGSTGNPNGTSRMIYISSIIITMILWFFYL